MPEQEQDPRGSDLRDFREYVSLIVRRSTLVLVVAVLIAWSWDAPLGRGLALGGVFSLLGLRLRAKHLLRLERSGARGAFCHAILIYLLTGAILAAAAARADISFPAAVAGLFLTRLNIVLEQAVPWLKYTGPTEADTAA